MSDEVELFGRALGRALGSGPPPASLGVQRANFIAAAHRMGRRKSRPRWGLAVAIAAALAVALGGFSAYQKERGARSAARELERARGARERRALGSHRDDEAARIFRWQQGRVRRELAREAFRARSEARRAAPRSGTFRREHRAPPEHDVGHRRGAVHGGSHRYEVQRRLARGPVEPRGRGHRRRRPRHGRRSRPRGDDPPRRTETRAQGRTDGRRGAEDSRRRSSSRRRREPSAPTAERTTQPPPGPRDPSLASLASAGKYREALELAEKQGFERVIGELGENDLLLLANSARYAGSSARARQALLKIRERFPGRPAADLAALYLARIAEQMEKRPQEAVRWLRTFLAESPTGDLAQSARASLLSILSAQGDTAGARAVATDYLRYHPEGPLAEQARSLVSRTSPP